MLTESAEKKVTAAYLKSCKASGIRPLGKTGAFWQIVDTTETYS